MSEIILRNRHVHRANKRVLITNDSNEEVSHLGMHIIDHPLFRLTPGHALTQARRPIGRVTEAFAGLDHLEAKAPVATMAHEAGGAVSNTQPGYVGFSSPVSS